MIIYRDLKNVGLNTFATLLPMGLSFLLAPILIRHYGLAEYAFVSMQLLIYGYIGVVEKPLGLAYGKMIGEILSSTKASFSFNFIKISLCSVIAVGTVAALCITVIKYGDDPGKEVLVLFLCLSVLARLVENLLRQALLAKPVHDTENYYIIVGVLVRFFAVLSVVTMMDYTIAAYFIIHIVISALLSMSYYLKITKILNGGSFSENSDRKHLKYIKNQSAVNILAVLVAQMDKSIVLTQLNSEAFAIYSLIMLFGSLNAIVANQICNSWLHRLNNAVQQNDNKLFRATLLRLFFMVFCLSSTLLICQLTLEQYIQQFLFGERFDLPYYDIAMLLFYVNSFFYVVSAALNAIYSVKIFFILNVFYAFLLPLMFYLFDMLGIVGVVLFGLALQCTNLGIGLYVLKYRVLPSPK